MGNAAGKRLGAVALVDVAVQFACFVVAAALRTEIFYDVSGSLTYMLCVLLSLRRKGSTLRQKVNTGLVILWASRLGTFLLFRILRDGRDVRFDQVRNNPRVFLLYWAIQALWILITALPVYVLNGKRAQPRADDALACDDGTSSLKGRSELASDAGTYSTSKICVSDVVGWCIWSMGFICEVTADMQKLAFQANPNNKGRWIDIGLWSLARHPNYFGEISMWWGIFLSCATDLRGMELLSGVSPCFVTYLLLRVSGVPMLARTGQQRWGHLPEYQAYLQNTRLLVPLP
eukprot:TRINITY_DN21407_c0_g1_i1.p1 TRINITY_DN21407_c0_g1~~TRINITY_DN21407_c0_g1_i1.p1  ORF type:complete len:307 (+),score=34.66 TRINITY_DN21407_c0_g1_i1:55-921(+)